MEWFHFEIYFAIKEIIIIYKNEFMNQEFHIKVQINVTLYNITNT